MIIVDGFICRLKREFRRFYRLSVGCDHPRWAYLARFKVHLSDVECLVLREFNLSAFDSVVFAPTFLSELNVGFVLRT